MLMKDANVLREHFERRLKQISPDSVAAYCIRLFLDAIDELPDVEVIPVCKCCPACASKSDPNYSPFDGNAMTQAEYFGLNGGGGEMAKECPFCRKMRVEKKRLKVSGTQARYKYAAALVTRIFLKGIRGQKAMHTDYSETNYGYKLNFCPVCGKKMDGGGKP